jgi:NAD(P)H-hydrate epimerase
MGTIKTFSTDQMKEIERRTVEEFGIPSLILMEHAGKAVANAAAGLAKPFEGTVAVICGPGNNGGDGFVAARHLYNRGYDVSVFLVKDETQIKAGDALANYNILKKMRIPCSKFESLPGDTSIIVDAMLGTGTKGEITGAYKNIIEAVNKTNIPVASVDIPSGIDADTGAVLGCAVKAAITVTFAGAKTGLVANAAKPYLGSLVIVDIGIPRLLIHP